MPAAPTDDRTRLLLAFVAGVAIGCLGGLIGLGGAEFRLPFLIGLFAFPALEAIILNKAMSLVVVATALPFRAGAVGPGELAANVDIIANLLVGSLLGAWFGAGWATRIAQAALHRTIAILLVLIAVVLLVGHGGEWSGLLPPGGLRVAVGVAAGFAIGVVASLLGVAGGELLIPAITILFGVDLKLAGSLSLAVSLPTMLIGFARYSRDQSFSVLRRNPAFLAAMATGSVVGTWIGGHILLGIVPSALLLPLLAAILVWSAWKVWSHG